MVLYVHGYLATALMIALGRPNWLGLCREEKRREGKDLVGHVGYGVFGLMVSWTWI